jgi:hypothetical protein
VDDDTVTTTDWPAWVDRCLDIAFEVETTVEERRARPDQGSGEHDRSRD